jgi:hypothetical protein
MTTLSSRLEQLAAMYHLQVWPLVMLFAVGLTTAPILAWTAGVLIVLETLNKLYHVFRRPESQAG